MAAEHEGGHILHRHIELERQEVAEAGGIEHAGHADDLLGRQARELLQRPDHRVERVGDADHEGVGRMRLEAFADRLHHLEVDAEQVVAAHAGLARHAGGHDADVGAGDIGVVRGALERGVEAFDRARFRDVQRLALGGAVSNVEQDDVTEFLERGEVGQRTADLACADEGNLGSSHGELISDQVIRWACA